MKEEMFLARKIQLGLIPQTLPDKENIAFEHLYEPMEEIGGDFYDFIDFENPEKIGIFISDVAGHGVPAALITSMLNSLLDVSENLKSSPKHFLHYLNTSLIKRTHDNFLTAFYCIYDQKTRKMKYSRAGHPEPILIRNGEVITIKSRGMLLGMIPDFKVEEKEIVLFPGDKVIFYTDGITECMNRDNVRFSEKFHEILKRNHTLPISDMVQLIHEKILEHRRSTHFEDDLCLIGMEAF
jgi:serine phosphatase RsbU (regulator of sigma subunit)